MKTLRIVPALLLLLACSLHAPSAQEAASAKPEPKLYQFLIYYMGSRIGWAKSVVSETELDGRKVVHEREEAWLQIKRSFDGQTFEVSSVTETWYELDGRAIKVVDVTQNGNQKVKLETVYQADQVTVSQSIDDCKPTVTTLKKEGRAVHCDTRAWRLMKDAKRLDKGERLDFWSVDDDDHALVEQNWTVNGRTKRKLSDKSMVEGVEIRVVRAGRSGTLMIGDDDMPVLIEDVGGFSLERTAKIPEPFVTERVSLRNTMDANVSIPEHRQLTRLEIHFEYEHDDDEFVPPIAESNDYHQVIKYDKGYAIRMNSRKFKPGFKAPKYPLAEIPDDVKKFLAPTAMCQSDDETLAAEAVKLAKGKTDAAAVARAIMRFADKRLDDGSGATGSASARQAYDEKAGDCTEHAALFVALARAAGLPARNVGGFVYACSPRGTVALFGYHAWAEVWLGEWIPVDATVNELGTSARYVFFDIDEPGETHGSARSSRCIRQNIKPVIDAYELADGTTWKRKGAPEFDWK